MLPLILLACQLGSVLSTEYPIKASVAIFKDAAFGSTTGMVESIGTVTFEQSKKDGEVKVTGTISGLKEGMHGFHIHERGDLFNGCADAKGHFNPDGVKHGGPKDAVRHVGDLGNVVSGADGITRFVITDNVISLLGRNSIIGRAVVVHEGKDDLGKGTGDAAAESQKTGNAGKRVGCGVVGVASAKYDSTDAMEAITTSARAVIFENKNFTGAPAKVLGSISLSIVGDHIKITGRSKSLTGGKHGFHVHDLGAIEGGCGGAKGHFNPKGVKHGGPTDAVRHVGDLGNVVAGADGFAHVDITDTAVKLGGWASVVGRAIVVHAGVDDLGKGTGAAAAGSQATGNAGARLGCGIIGIVESTPAPPRAFTGNDVALMFM